MITNGNDAIYVVYVRMSRPWFNGYKQFNWLEYIRYIVVSWFAVAD